MQIRYCMHISLGLRVRVQSASGVGVVNASALGQ